MLSEIVEEIERNPGPITVGELASRLEVDQEALKGMLEFLSRKGRIAWGDPTREFVCREGTCASCLRVKDCERFRREG